MADKHRYQVRYLVKAIVGITVNATSFDEARNAAKKVVAKNIWADELDSIEERLEYQGVDDMTVWDEVSG